jgi:D-alanine-D-alanine ligase
MLKIGFVFDVPPLESSPLDDVSVEYEDKETLEWIRGALSSIGGVVDVPWSADAVATLDQLRPDVLFNITEASGSRNRESLVPAIAESLGIAYTGSDAVSLGISLDKHFTKIIAGHLNITTPGWGLVLPGMAEPEILAVADQLRYPLIVKPNTGGSSMGIRADSKVADPDELLDVAGTALSTFKEPMLVEEFISGRELTTGLLQDGELRALPTAEITFGLTEPQKIGGRRDEFYSIERKNIHQKEVHCPADLPSGVAVQVSSAALSIFKSLGCRDMARVDYRLGDDGVPYFIEINPLPGLSPYYSIFPMQAMAAGISAERLIQTLVRNAVGRSNGGEAV